MNTDAHTTDRNPEAIKPTSPGTRLVLLLLITAGAVLTGLCSNLFVAGIFAAVTAGLFTYYYLLTFSPADTRMDMRQQLAHRPLPWRPSFASSGEKGKTS